MPKKDYQKEIKIVLEGERPSSWNKIYASRHWIFRKELADSVHRKVVRELEKMGFKPMGESIFKELVDILVVAYFKNRPIDPDNIGAKLYIDPLKFTLIQDDTRKFVRNVTTRSEIDAENPRVEITITQV